MNLTPVVIAEGHALADRLFGAMPRRWSMDRVATAVFSSPPIATVGLTELQAAARGSADIYLTRFTPMRHLLGGRSRHTMMKLVVDQQTQVVLGAHIIGDDAPEMMQGVSVAINCGATKADFDATIGIHPTSAEEFVTLRTRTRVAEGSCAARAGRPADAARGDGGRRDGAGRVAALRLGRMLAFRYAGLGLLRPAQPLSRPRSGSGGRGRHGRRPRPTRRTPWRPPTRRSACRRRGR